MGRKPYKKARKGKGPRHYIREWREFRNLTQEQVAGRTEMSVSQISKIETGDRDYRQSTLELFAAAFGCEPKDLLAPPPAARNEIAETMGRLSQLDETRQKAVLRAVNAILDAA